MAAKQLDGHPGDRIGDLRTNLGMTKKELSQKTGIDASQITRIENGSLKTISSDYLIKLAKELKTSTDYILGLTPVSVPKSYDISELGLSNEAVKGLVTGTIDVGILNRLLEHKSFPRLIHLIRVYFQDTAARGVMVRNQLIEMATASLSDLIKEHPEHRTEAKQDLQFLNAQKLGEHEAELEKINVLIGLMQLGTRCSDGSCEAAEDLISGFSAIEAEAELVQIGLKLCAAAVISAEQECFQVADGFVQPVQVARFILFRVQLHARQVLIASVAVAFDFCTCRNSFADDLLKCFARDVFHDLHPREQRSPVFRF